MQRVSWRYTSRIRTVSYTHLDVYKRQFYGLGADDVLQELRRREGISGSDEKKSRGTGHDHHKKAKDGHK